MAGYGLVCALGNAHSTRDPQKYRHAIRDVTERRHWRKSASLVRYCGSYRCDIGLLERKES